MPGHIYYRLGDYDRARQSFLDSMKVDEEYMHREKVSTLDDWNYAHNLSYLVASDAESGRLREALEMAARLDKLPANPFIAKGSPNACAHHRRHHRAPPDPLRQLAGDRRSSHRSRLRPGFCRRCRQRRIATEFWRTPRECWRSERKDLEGAAHASDALDAVSWRLHADDHGDDAGGSPDRVLDLLEMLSLDLRGNLKSAQSKHDEAIELLKNAIDKQTDVGYGEPPRYGRPELESLGYAYIRAGKWELARKAFQDEMITRPASGHALYGIAQSYELAGDKQAAARAYSEFLAAWKNADPDLPMVKHAESSSH